MCLSHRRQKRFVLSKSPINYLFLVKIQLNESAKRKVCTSFLKCKTGSLYTYKMIPVDDPSLNINL